MTQPLRPNKQRRRKLLNKENINQEAFLVQKHYGVKIDVEVPLSLSRRNQIMEDYLGTKTPIV